MTQEPLLPDRCQTMDEVRVGVDAADRALLDLLARRFGYMRAAARIKQKRESVRDEARKARIIAAVRAWAEEAGVPPESAARLWDLLVEESIAYELDEWDRLRR